MPVNYHEIQGQIRQMGEQEPQRVQRLQALKQQAAELLETWNTNLDQLKSCAAQAAAVNRGLRCAVPVAEPLMAHYPPPVSPSGIIILAADGSQINPSRHDSVPFGVINVGAFRMAPGSGLAPAEVVHSELITGDQLYMDNGGAIGEEAVALRRDLNERQLLADLAFKELRSAPQALVIALTDGPLEPFVRDPQEREDVKQLFADYLQSLRALASPQVAAAGYVDKPRSDLVVRLLELVDLAQRGRLERAGHERSLPGVTDAGLLSEHLQPGDRSAVFGLQSRSREAFSDEIELHFFYVNVGRPQRPSLVRVEVPAWVANNADLLGLLHAVLIDQCQMLGTRPYPYALHRSHEVAVVRLEEKQQLQAMIEMELRRRGMEPGDSSAKQFTKDHSGDRKRYS
jgi:hypothetical protein